MKTLDWTGARLAPLARAGLAALPTLLAGRGRSAQQARPVHFSFQVVRFHLPHEGAVDYARWLHPKERDKSIRQDDVDGLRQYIAPGDLVIDVGAHTGDTTIPLALAAGREGLTLALEPNPFVFRVLEQNASLNRASTNIVAMNVAATAEEGSYTFHYSDAAYCNGGHLAGRGWRRGHRHQIEVRGTNLVRLLREQFADWLPRLSLIKIDTEGYDKDVLASMDDLLRACRPVVICEVFRRLDGPGRDELYDRLAGAGYDCFFYRGGASPRGEAVCRRDMHRCRHFDVIALPGRRTG